jgi:hypothetical protein
MTRMPSRLNKTPQMRALEQEERLRIDEITSRRWRHRRIGYGICTVSVGSMGPALALSLASSIAHGSFAAWVSVGWWLLGITIIGGSACSLLLFLRGWGISLGMITYALLFMSIIAIYRSAMAELLPAMPGLVCMFVSVGALVGYLTTLEEGS